MLRKAVLLIEEFVRTRVLSSLPLNRGLAASQNSRPGMIFPENNAGKSRQTKAVCQGIIPVCSVLIVPVVWGRVPH